MIGRLVAFASSSLIVTASVVVPGTSGHPSSGVIAGRVAVMGRAAAHEEPASGRCDVHLVRIGSETNEIVQPCLTWFQPPVGRYLFWLQSPTSVSEQSILNYAGEQSTIGKAIEKRLMPAGSVRLNRRAATPDSAEFRVVSLNTTLVHHQFDRRVRLRELSTPLVLPAGHALAGIFDASGQALALSNQLTIDHGQTTLVVPTVPSPRYADLLVVLNRHAAVAHPPRCIVALDEPDQKTRRPPDIHLTATDRVLLLWRNLMPGMRRLRVSCGESMFERSVNVLPGRISTVRDILAEREIKIHPAAHR